MMLHERFEQILEAVREACLLVYRERLISIGVFGSVARGTMRPDSDIDLLLVVEDLPDGRMPRMRTFEAVEEKLGPDLENAAEEGINTVLAAVFKTPQELTYGSPLFLDMTEEARILYDPNNTLADYLEGLRSRLRALGARRVRAGGGYYWLLKPDLKPGEDFTL